MDSRRQQEASASPRPRRRSQHCRDGKGTRNNRRSSKGSRPGFYPSAPGTRGSGKDAPRDVESDTDESVFRIKSNHGSSLCLLSTLYHLEQITRLGVPRIPLTNMYQTHTSRSLQPAPCLSAWCRARRDSSSQYVPSTAVLDPLGEPCLTQVPFRQPSPYPFACGWRIGLRLR